MDRKIAAACAIASTRRRCDSCLASAWKQRATATTSTRSRRSGSLDHRPIASAIAMDKPRIFLGSSGKQAKLLQALTRGLEDVAHVEPRTAVFNPGTTTLGRLLEL